MWYWLSQIPGIGIQKQYELLEHFHLVEKIFGASETELMRCKSLTKKDIENVFLYRRNANKVQEEYQRMLEQGIRFVDLDCEEYPEQLKQCYRPPIGLFMRGKKLQAEKKKVAIVGARMCTPYGKSMARQIGKELALHGVEVVSGMARGIDGYAHQGALSGGGVTYAILAGGVDVIYPPEHRDLYDAILQTGGVISEYKPQTIPSKGMFPLRNRIISGMCDAVILVEAREKSGSLITADLALEQGRDIYVVPGRITDPLSRGCNQYIQQGAQVITSISDLLERLEVGDCSKNLTKENKKNTLEKEEALVYSCLRLTPQGIEELSEASGLGLMKVMEVLARLRELELIEECYINQFIRSV